MNEHPKQKNRCVSYEYEKCGICGSQDYEWGTAVGQHAIQFKSNHDPQFWLDRLFGMTLRVRVCKVCGNGQIFVTYQRDLESS